MLPQYSSTNTAIIIVQIMENMGFVKDVQSLFLQLGCIPGALLSEDYSAKLSNESLAGPSTAGVPVSIVQTPCPSRGELNNRQVAPQTHNLTRVVEAKVLPSNLDSRQQQHSVPYNAKSAFDNLPGSGPFGQPGLMENLQYHLDKCNEARNVNDWKTILKETESAISLGVDSAPQVSWIAQMFSFEVV